MAGALVTAALIGGALLLTLVVPHLLVRCHRLRTVPGQGLLLWQALSLAGVVSALLAAPVAALTVGTERPWLLAAALLLSGLMLARLLWSGHRIGTDLRRMRSEHRRIVDLVGDRLDGREPEGREPGTGRRRVSVVAQASPTAYCLPGRRDRIVLSRAAVERLGPDELGAVLAHERAHLRQRHDLLRLAFESWHRAVAWLPTTATARRAVAQLTEMLADDAALKTHDRADLVRAIVLTGEAEGAARGTAGQGTERTVPNVQEDGSVPLTLRFYRLLDPARPLPWPLRLAAILTALGLAVLPVVLLVQM